MFYCMPPSENLVSLDYFVRPASPQNIDMNAFVHK